MKKYLILDTETTGLDDNSEIVEICIIDNNANVLINQRIKPTKAIPDIATKIHGITDDDVKNCPTWRDIYDDVIMLLTADPVYIYNAKYDLRLIEQTTALYSCLLEKRCHQIRPQFKSYCVMNEVAKRANLKRGAHVSLMSACERFGINFDSSKNHAALYDCIKTLEIIRCLKSIAKNDG